MKIAPLSEKYSPKWWKSQITSATERRKKFIEYAEESIRVYNAQKQVGMLNDVERRLNVWWYVNNTLLPAYFSSTPKAEVNLRKRTGGIAAELGSVILERNLQYAMDVNFDFDTVGYNAAIQLLLTGQSVLWARYVPKFETVLQEITLIKDPSGALIDAEGMPFTGDAQELKEGPGGIMLASLEVEQKVDERAVLELIQYSDYLCSDGRNEQEIEWQGRRAFLDKTEAEEKFGKDIAKTLKYDSYPEVIKNDIARKDDKFEGKAEIYEIWCEATGKVYFIQQGREKSLIEVSEPHTRFDKFYPCTVIRQSTDPDSVVPVSDYAHVKDQILEVERLTTRIHAVTQAIRTNQLYDATLGNQVEQLYSGDLKVIPVTNWPSYKQRGGLAAGIESLNIEPYINALNVLQGARQSALQQLYETLKVSDLLRGTSEQYKSATANRLENQWSSLGLIVRQNMFAKFISDGISNLGAIICQHFDEERIFEIGDADGVIEPVLYIPPPPPAQEGAPPPVMPTKEELGMMMKQQIMGILRDPKLRCYRVQIASDSMVAIDQAQQQQEATNIMQTAGAFFDQMRGLIDQYPPLAEFSIALFQNIVKRFKGAKEVDGIFTKALYQITDIAKAKEEAAKQPPPPDPKMLEMQGRMQIAQIESQARVQAAQMEMQDKAVKNQLAAQEQQLKMQRDQLEAQLRVQDQQFKEYMEQQKLSIDQQEVQVKAQAVQVDMLKVQSSAQSESDKALIKQESSQMQHILEIQKLELEQMRIRLSESEKLMEERRLASENALEQVRFRMENITNRNPMIEPSATKQQPIVINNIIPKASKKLGTLGTDSFGNTTLSIDNIDED
jgi:hypothetical protein